MNPETSSTVAIGWVVQLLGGVLLVIFSFLAGQKRAERLSVTKSDCASSRELLEQSRTSDIELQSQKLLRIEDRIAALEVKVDQVCIKIDALRGLVVNSLASKSIKG